MSSIQSIYNAGLYNRYQNYGFGSSALNFNQQPSIFSSILGGQNQQNPWASLFKNILTPNVRKKPVTVDKTTVTVEPKKCEEVHGSTKLTYQSCYGWSNDTVDKFFQMYDVNNDEVLDTAESAALLQTYSGGSKWNINQINTAKNVALSQEKIPTAYAKNLCAIQDDPNSSYAYQQAIEGINGAKSNGILGMV